MQTFLPYPDFAKSVACLDDSRLMRQRLDCMIVLATANGVLWVPHENRYVLSKAARLRAEHPVVVQWAGHLESLAEYALAAMVEWQTRGNFEHLGWRLLKWFYKRHPGGNPKPPWFGDDRIHSAHRAVLLGKDYEYYRKADWTETPAVPDISKRWPYVWPQRIGYPL